MPNRKRGRRTPRKHWTEAKTYEELKVMTSQFSPKRIPQENWAIMERMRQLRYGYEPGELKMDKSVMRSYTMEEFRKITEQEYEEEIRKYGPR